MKHWLSEMGVVCALGEGAAEVERRLRLGDTSGMKPVALANGDTSRFGLVDWPEERFRTAPTRVDALLDAVMAQLDLDSLFRDFPAERIGAVIGTSNSTMEEFTDNPDRIEMGHPADRLRERWGVRGPAWCVSTACSSSGKVFETARRLLEHRLCDAVIAGGVDARTRTVIEGFHALESLAPGLVRPLAADRDGINLGEGAAVFVMRRVESVPEADGICLLGVGESSDAYHLTAPDPSGKGAEAAMRRALAAAGMEPGQVDYVNLHGTGTTYNDAMECAAMSRVFERPVWGSSTKPLTGHCLGAAGAIGAALCWLAIRAGDFAPPQVGTPDENLVRFRCPPPGNGVRVRVALSNSFAFGGSNASVLLGIDPK